MAREPSITQEQVSRAAEAIRDSGSKPTARAIRERLGAGSMATVLKFYQAWAEAQIRPSDPPVVLPPPLQKGLLDFVAAEVARSKSELNGELDAANQANEDLIRENERQALVVDNLTSALETAHADKATLAGQLREVEAERDVARQEATAERQAAEAARTELAKALLRLESMPRLEKELDELRQELQQERDARFASEQTAAVASAKLEGALQAKAAADTAQSRAVDEMTAAREELKAAHALNAQLQADFLAAVRPAPVKPMTRKPLKPQTAQKKA